jgi:hypothetical protein
MDEGMRVKPTTRAAEILAMAAMKHIGPRTVSITARMPPRQRCVLLRGR